MAANDPPEDEGDEHSVVELPQHGDEIRDEIEREREVRDQRADEELVAPRQAFVAEQA